MPRIQLRLTPRGHLLLEEADDAPILDDKVAARLTEAFGRSTGYGLLQLGAGEIGQSLPPAFIWWRDFAVRYLEAVCLHGSGGTGETPSAAFLSAIALPADAELATLVLTAPMMPGAEYLTADILRRLWADLGTAFMASFRAAGTDLQAFLKTLNPAWNLIGRVHFNLAENRRDPEWPFAFLATYTTRLSAQGKGPACAARPSFARIRWRRQSRQAVVAAGAGAACSGAPQLAQGHGRCRRDLSSRTLEPSRGRTAPEQRARPGKRRCSRALACSLARRPSIAPAGDCYGWRPSTIGDRP